MNRKEIIMDFYKQVCERAEDKMLKTGKLEGAHYASMKEIIEEIKNTSDNSECTVQIFKKNLHPN